MQCNVFAPACPTRDLLDRIADKWTVLVVCALAEKSMRFGALRRELGGVSQKVLTQVLRSLERDGIVSRHVFSTEVLHVEYRITPLGRSLFQCLDDLRHWAEDRFGQVAAARAAYDERSPSGHQAPRLKKVAR